MLRTIAAIITILTLFASFSIARSADLNTRIQEKLKELDAINQEIKKNQEILETVQTQKNTLNNELKKIDTGIKQVDLGIQSSEVTISKLGLELESLGNDITTTKIRIDEQKKTMVELIRRMQEQDNTSLAASLLENTTLSDIFLEIQSIQDLNQGLLTSVARMRELNNELTIRYEDRSDKKTGLEQEKTNLQKRQSILSSQKDQRANLLAQTKNQEKIYQQQLSALEEKQQSIGAEIEEIEEELRRQADPTLLPSPRPGLLAWPMENVRITQEYGGTSFAQRAYKSKFHNGIDFGAPTGTPIYAADDGEIFAVGDNGRYQYGKHVVIKHNSNIATLYAHMSAYGNIKEGQAVKQGQLIGYIGSTGYAFGAHLHFMTYWSPSVRRENLSNCNCGLVPLGVTINPMDYLPSL